MPFSTPEFFDVFARYNLAIWPVQVLAYVAGLTVLALALRPFRYSVRSIGALLALMWAVNGIGYHLIFFTAINPLAQVFGVAFLVQAVALAVWPWIQPRAELRLGRDARGTAALALAVFAMVLYPLWGYAAGHGWPGMPAFGVAPCPTTIFTIAILLLAPWRAARWLLIIPGLWALVGGSAAILLRVPQDTGLLFSAALIVAFSLARRRIGWG
ncbi:MAG: DUF6064 family protein [Roseovarius sp.]|nr:DUF6064 family protein [Roseovarius sp.]